MNGTPPRVLEVQIAFAERIGRLLAALGQRDAYLVGGYVRSLIMGMATDDFDVVVVGGDGVSLARGIADQLGAAFYTLDPERGYGRVVGENERHAVEAANFTIDVTPAFGDSIETDLSRRDFSIDAMAVPMRTPRDVSTIIDPYDGREDIERRLIRALGDGVFRDDPARLLRAVRLAGQLGFEIEEGTASTVKADVSFIGQASPDRRRDEVCRMLALDASADALAHADELGLLSQIFPEVEDSRGIEQPREHYWDMFDHLIETVRAFDFMLDGARRESDAIVLGLPWPREVSEYFAEELVSGRTRAIITKLACLFHDVAKPQTRTIDSDGRMRFFGHGEQGARIAADAMARLRFSRREIDFASATIAHHLRPVQMSQNLEPPSKRAIYRYREALGDAGIATLYLSMADYLAAKGPMLEMPKWETRSRYCGLVLDRLLVHDSLPGGPTPSIVDGHVLMEELDLRPGRALGRLLATVKEAIAVGEVETREEAVAMARELADSDTKIEKSQHLGHSEVSAQ